MPTLYVENVPKDVYDALRARAKSHRRSIAAEVLSLLEQNIPTEKELKARQALLRQMERLQAKELTTVPSLTLLESAFIISTTFDRSAYDCFYLAVAVLLQINFVTADERLANAVGSALPIKWLGAM